jgi:hypothetical protein
MPEWRPLSGQATLLALRGCPVRHDAFANAMLDLDGPARAWVESESFGTPPRVREPISALALTAAEIAAWYPPPDLFDDDEVMACQAWFQGMCNRHATDLLAAPTAHRVQSGLNKIVNHPTTLILVAAPHVPARQLVNMVDGHDANLRAVENSLYAGTQMGREEIRAWLESPVLRPALLIAAENRVPVGPGWWRAGGLPLVSPTTTRRQTAEALP